VRCSRLWTISSYRAPPSPTCNWIRGTTKSTAHTPGLIYIRRERELYSMERNW
jgi:hypothetical protein